MEKRNQIILSLLVNQALLVSDIEGLRTEDLDLKNAKIKVKSTGITNERILDLKAEQILLFYQYLQEDRECLEKEKNSFFY